MRKLLDEKQIEYVTVGSKVLEIIDTTAVVRLISDLKPSIIYHCVAYTAVDEAEGEGKKCNWLVNVQGTKNVAQATEAV